MIISMDMKMASFMLELVMQPLASTWKDEFLSRATEKVEMGYSRVPSDVFPPTFPR